jgi:hypothetical protein
MRVKSKVTDLTIHQWDYLQSNVMTSYDMPTGVVRVCAEFELTEMLTRHAEMPVHMFAGLLTQLEHITLIEAALTPDALPDTEAGQGPLPGPTCDHGATVAEQEPSAFSGAEPIRTYSDGCQSYGPYSSDGPPVAEVHDPATGRYTVDPDQA